MKVLLDNDVFFAALVRSHPAHTRSRRWLDRAKPGGWGIACETYLAAIRLLMNPKVMGPGALNAKMAVLAVETELSGAHAGEIVLACRIPAAELLEKAAGHRQIMDIWLVQIARDSGCKLATLDAGMLSHWPELTMRVGQS